MHIKLITVGRLKPGALLTLAQEYQKRITSKLQIIEVETKETHLTPAQRQEKEMRLICAHLEDSDCLLVLDMQGDNVTSEQLAQTLNKFQQTYKKIEILIVDDNSSNFLEILNIKYCFPSFVSIILGQKVSVSEINASFIVIVIDILLINKLIHDLLKYFKTSYYMHRVSLFGKFRKKTFLCLT